MTTDQPGAPYEPTLLDLPVLPYGDAETGRSSGWSGSETSAERAHTEDADGTTSERQQTVLLWLNLRRSAGCTWKELAEAKGWHHGQASGVLSGLHKEGKIARLAEERRHRCAVYVLPQWVADRPTVAQGRARPEAQAEADLSSLLFDALVADVVALADEWDREGYGWAADRVRALVQPPGRSADERAAADKRVRDAIDRAWGRGKS